MLALREFFQSLQKSGEQASSEKDASTEQVSGAQRRANRKFTIRPGDWDGIQVPGNRNFSFNPDGTTSNERKRRRSNRFKVRFWMDRI